MELQHLVDKLSLQVNELQDGFEILSKASSLQELGNDFSRILRGNFLVTEVQIFHKASGNDWISLINGSTGASSIPADFDPDKKLEIRFLDKIGESILITISLVDDSQIAVVMGKKMDNSSFSEMDKITIQIFMQMFDNAYQSLLNRRKEKELIFGLNEKVLQLNSLIDTGIEISKFEKQNVLLLLALQRAAVLTNASIGIVEVKTNDKIEEKVFFPSNEVEELISSAVSKTEYSFKFQNRIYKFTLCNKESRKGTLEFGELDNTLLEAITSQVYAALENAHLLREALVKERIEQELNVAASIQQKIIPSELPKIEGYDVAGINIPSREVGGDYYDCIDLGGGKFALIMADVAGKGIAASLLVNTLNASLYSFLNFKISLTEMSDKLNKIIYNASPSDKFITFFIAVLDSLSGELDIVNAGHNPVLHLKKNGTLFKIEAGGVGLGMFDLGMSYEGSKLTLNKGDRLFLFTDGIPEAMNINDEEYSDEKMEKIFIENKTETSRKFIDLIVADVNSFVGNAEQSDDITAMYLIRK